MSGAVAHRLAGNNALHWLVCIVGGAAIHLYLWQVSEPAYIFSDFYKAYYPAAEALWEQGLSATWPLTEQSAGGFVNIPIIAWLFVPLVPLGEEQSGWAFLAVGALAALATWALLARLARPEAKWAAPLLLFLGLVNGPMLNSLREGNTTHFILLLLVVALLLWRKGWQYVTGLVLGLCAVIKLPLFLFGVYFFLRGKWRVVAGGATAIGTAVLLSLADYGLEGNIAWYNDAVAPFLGGVIPAFNVQSIDGFLMRLWIGETRLHNWDPVQPELAHKLIRFALFAVVYGSAVALGRRANRAEPMPIATGKLSVRDVIEYCLVLNIAVLTSPISWTHYYLWLLLPIGLYLGGNLPLPNDQTTHRLMWSSIVLTSLPVVMPEQFPPTLINAVLARTVISAWFFGGLLMLTALMRGLWSATRPSPST